MIIRRRYNPKVVLNVGFSTSNSWISRLIRWALRTPYSHAFLRITLYKQQFIYHSASNGIVLALPKDFEKSNTVIKEYKMYLEKSEPVMAELLLQLGDRYDWGGLIGQSWVILGRLFGKKWANPLQSKKRWYCSEVIASELEELGISLPVKPSAVDPKLLDEILANCEYAALLPDEKPKLLDVPKQ